MHNVSPNNEFYVYISKYYSVWEHDNIENGTYSSDGAQAMAGSDKSLVAFPNRSNFMILMIKNNEQCWTSGVRKKIIQSRWNWLSIQEATSSHWSLMVENRGGMQKEFNDVVAATV